MKQDSKELNEQEKDTTKQNNGSKKGQRSRSKSARSKNRNRKNSAQLNSAGRHNDPNWYFLSPEVADQASSFAFDSFIGVDTPVEGYLLSNKTITDENVVIPVPSIMTLKVNPSPGVGAGSLTSGINLAALKTYSTLSSNNSKTTQYAPQDITMLILTLGEVVSTLEHLRRLFGVAFLYNQRNRDIPHRLLKALGIEPDEFLENIAQHRLEFNSWITALNKVPFLANVAYLSKCATIYQNVYIDSESPMAQIYAMIPDTTWVLNETYNEQGSGLVTTEMPFTWSGYRELINNMIESLFTSSTFNYIYADVLNFSSKNGAPMFGLEYLSEGYTVIPVYNRNFLMQVHNAQFFGRPYVDSENIGGTHTHFNDVSCDVNKNVIKYNPVWQQYASSHYKSALIDLDTPTPSVEDRIESTRYVSIMAKGVLKNDLWYCSGVVIPDHYITNIVIHSGEVDALHFQNNMLKSTGEIHNYAQLTQFDWAPLMYVDWAGKLRPFGDLNYYTLLGYDWFTRVDSLAYQALFELR